MKRMFAIWVALCCFTALFSGWAAAEAEETVMVAIMLACALYRLIGRWKSSSVLGRAAGVVLVLFPLVIGGCAGDLFVFVLFQFLLAIIYILPCRKYRQEGKLKCFSLWIAQFIVLMLLVLPTVNFRISLLWRSEASFGYAILMMPVVTVLPVVLFDLFGPNRT